MGLGVLENIVGKRLWRGVHVPEYKEQTSHLPIRRLPFAPLLVVPLSQHTGAPAVSIVREGQEVVRGEPIAEADGFVSVPMHAPATGRVERIALAPSARGDLSPAIYIRPYASASQEIFYGAPQDIEPDDAGGDCPRRSGYRSSRLGRRRIPYPRQAAST